MKKFLKVLGGIIAFLFCLIILVIQMGAHFLFATNTIFSEKTINKIVDNTSISYLLQDEDGNKNSISETIYSYMKDLGFKEESVNKAVDSKGFKNIVKGILVNAVNNTIHNNKEIIITEEELKVLIDDNLDNIIAESGMTITATKKDALVKTINSSLNDLVKKIPTTSEINEQNAELKDMQTIFKKSTKIEYLVVLIVLTLAIAFFEWSIIKCLRDSGIVTIIAATLILILGTLIAFVAPYILRGIPDFTNYLSFIKPIIKVIGMIFVINGAIALVAGIIQSIVASVLKKNKEKRIEKGTILAG